MNMKQKLKFWAARFGRNEDGGTVAIEFVMMVPLLAWAFLSTITYFHAYRTEAIAHKAGLTIADMISREADYITPQYLSGARSLLRFLTLDDKYPDIRITVAYWDAGENKYKRAWSKERGPRSPLTQSEVAALHTKLPILTDQERVVIVETWTEYEARYAVGQDDFDMSTFTAISPRFVDRICWNATPDQGADTEQC